MSDISPLSRLRVNLAAPTGALKYGATGFLYGLGSPGIPAFPTLAGLKPQVAAQKPQDGLQHPNGDALDVAPLFQAAGGREIEIYLQDVYAQWPYENLGLADYLEKVEQIVSRVLDGPQPGLFSYVPFNEPDQIWYNLSGLRQQLLDDWLAVYRKIKSLAPSARLVGPNFARYDSAFYHDFLAFCLAHDCLPEVVSWHELNPDFYAGWYQRVADYRTAERGLGISPREVCINEYAQIKGELGIPGKLVQWVARFENSKVDACLAYWTDAGSLNNLVTPNHYNQVTGGWWLYRWYAEMSGSTVRLLPPLPDAPGLQGLASLDGLRKQARVLFGGGSGETEILIEGLESASFLGKEIHVQVWEAANTGLQPSPGPRPVLESVFAAQAGSLAVHLSQVLESSAYLMVLTPAGMPLELRGSAPDCVLTAAQCAYHAVRIRVAPSPLGGAARVRLNGLDLPGLTCPVNKGPDWSEAELTLFLNCGVNLLSLHPQAGGEPLPFALVSSIPNPGPLDVYPVAAPDCQLSGSAVLVADPAAPGGWYAAGIGNGPDNALSFTRVLSPREGLVRLLVHFANAESRGGHSYNSQIVDRWAEISVNGGPAQKVYFRNTFDWQSYSTRLVDIQFQAGENTILFANPAPGAYAPRIARVEIALPSL